MALFVQPGTVSKKDSKRFQRLMDNAVRAGVVLANGNRVRVVPFYLADSAADVILAGAVRDGLKFAGVVAQLASAEFRCESLDDEAARLAVYRGLKDFARTLGVADGLAS